MSSITSDRTARKQAARTADRDAKRDALVETILDRDPDGSWLSRDYPNRAIRRALREQDPQPNVARQNRSDARPRKQRAKAVKAARLARTAEARRARKYGTG